MSRSRVRTSLTHPLQIAALNAPSGGVIGVTFCPGKQQPNSATGSWARDLGLDLDAVCDWGARVLLTLITPTELAGLKVEGLGEAARARGLAWLHLPIEDVTAPTPHWERRWAADRAAVHHELDAGGRVVVHCKGGLGRAGTVAALILVERGMAPGAAIAAVRAQRRGAIETAAQAAYVSAAREPWRGAQA